MKTLYRELVRYLGLKLIDLGIALLDHASVCKPPRRPFHFKQALESWHNPIARRPNS